MNVVMVVRRLRSVLILGVLAAAIAQAMSGQEVTKHYTVVDEGLSLVRTLTDTPGLNNLGDFATWHPVSASLMPGVIIQGNKTVAIDGDKDFSLVYPADINDQKVVVGTLQQPQDLRFTHAFAWSNHRLQILPALGGAYAAATAINATGNVVGSAETRSHARHAVLWPGTHPRDLGLLEKGDYSSARDINDKNTIVGEANVTPNGKPLAFVWRAGSMEQLPTLPGGAICSAQALNNSDAIVGSCDLANGTAHGVIWRNRKVEDLGSLGGDADSASTPLDINDQGQVVGSSSADDKLRAFLWENGKMIDLNKTLPAKSGWLLLVASRINDNGEIVGRGYFRGYVHAFLLRPVPSN